MSEVAYQIQESPVMSLSRNCNDCDEPIPAQRLIALPKTSLCVECQEENEKNGTFQRHRGSFDIRFKNDEIESMEMNVVRADT